MNKPQECTDRLCPKCRAGWQNVLHTPKGKSKESQLCPNCGLDIAIRNPSGKCDHLYRNIENFKIMYTGDEVKKELRKRALKDLKVESQPSWGERFDEKFVIEHPILGIPIVNHRRPAELKEFIAEVERETTERVRGKLNYLKMLEDICNYVETDWAAEMEMKTIRGSKPFTQEEAVEMAHVLGKIYSIAHGINDSCGLKYKWELSNKEETK